MKKHIILMTCAIVGVLTIGCDKAEDGADKNAVSASPTLARAAGENTESTQTPAPAKVSATTLSKKEAMELLADAQKILSKKELDTDDYKKAYKKAFKAADAGNLPEAQFLVGSLIFNGQGVDINYKESYKWLTLSNIYKVEGSRELMNSNYRKLSKEERAEANLLVKEFLATHAN